MNKALSRLLAIVLLLMITSLSTTELFSQNEDFAIIYLIRLKKSTNSTVSYNAYIDDKLVGMMNGNNPVFTDEYTAKWLVFNCAAKQKRVIKITRLNKKNYNATLVLNTEKGKRYFIVFDPAASVNENPLSLIDNKKGYEYLYKAASEDVVVVDKEIFEQVKYEKKQGFIDIEKAVNDVEKVKEDSSPIEKLNLNVPNINIENVNNKAVVYGNDEFKTLWKIIINNSKLSVIKKAFLDYKFVIKKDYKEITEIGIKDINKEIEGFKDYKNAIIIYLESEETLLLGIDKK